VPEASGAAPTSRSTRDTICSQRAKSAVWASLSVLASSALSESVIVDCSTTCCSCIALSLHSWAVSAADARPAVPRASATAPARMKFRFITSLL
jgi:hypothetical protein